MQQHLERCTHTGTWLSARPGLLLERTSLPAQEWHDGLFFYGMVSPQQGYPTYVMGALNSTPLATHALNFVCRVAS